MITTYFVHIIIIIIIILIIIIITISSKINPNLIFTFLSLFPTFLHHSPHFVSPYPSLPLPPSSPPSFLPPRGYK